MQYVYANFSKNIIVRHTPAVIDKKQMKNTLQEITIKGTRKYSASTYPTALSNRTVKKSQDGSGGGRGGVLDAGGKIVFIYL